MSGHHYEVAIVICAALLGAAGKPFIRASQNVMRRYAVAILLYALLVGWAGMRFTRTNPSGVYIAARKLVQNHRIVAGDLRKPSEWPSSAGWYLPDDDALVGRYIVSGPVSPCAPISDAVTGSSPSLKTGAGMNLLSLPLPDGSPLAGILDAESIVQLVAPKATPMEATIQAILCDPAPAPDKKGTCYVVFSAPTDVEDLVTRNRDAIRILPKTIAQPETCKE